MPLLQKTVLMEQYGPEIGLSSSLNKSNKERVYLEESQEDTIKRIL